MSPFEADPSLNIILLKFFQVVMLGYFVPLYCWDNIPWNEICLAIQVLKYTWVVSFLTLRNKDAINIYIQVCVCVCVCVCVFVLSAGVLSLETQVTQLTVL